MIQAIFVFLQPTPDWRRQLLASPGKDDSCLHSVHRETSSSLKLNSGVSQNLLLETWEDNRLQVLNFLWVK